jgi:phospholipid/cholesterol/gamma-HCH transport system substrate-binding protein
MDTTLVDTAPVGFRRGLRAIALLTAIALALAVVAWLVFFSANGKRVTAYFSAAVGLYPGSAVRVLGVQVGTVDEVVPEGTQVRLTMTLDDDVSVPANAKAAVVAPSVVSDRYVQLSPVYSAGPTLATGAVIPRDRTMTTVELDELYASLKDLSTALGPDGANADGALSELLRVAADNMAGNGGSVNEMIQQLSEATKTLSASREDLFGTIAGLQKFTTMLATNDAGVSVLIGQLADVADYLAGERDDLGAALGELAEALQAARSFVHDNRGKVQSNVDKLESVTRVLVEQRSALAEALDVMPNTVSNFYEAYNPRYRVWDSRSNLDEFYHYGSPGAPVLPLPPVDTPAAVSGGGR